MAVAFAFILWLVVYNLNDPIKTKTFTATVSIGGTDSVVDMGKWPEIKDSDKTISFSVSGKRRRRTLPGYQSFIFYTASIKTSTMMIHLKLSKNRYRMQQA